MQESGDERHSRGGRSGTSKVNKRQQSMGATAEAGGQRQRPRMR